MAASIAYQALMYLLRSSSSPEVTTNDILQSLLDTDADLRKSFLTAVGKLGGQDLIDCQVERESYHVDPVTGKQSYRDFRISRQSETHAIIETKIDSALTSHDQAMRYFEQLTENGLLLVVTREPLVRALAVQVGSQLEVTLHEETGVHRGLRGSRGVIVLSWRHLLRSVVSSTGDQFSELLSLDKAIEGITDFIPFTTAVQDISVGRTVTQVAGMAEDLCARLPDHLIKAGVKFDKIGRVQSNGNAVWTKLTILSHEFWVGYDAEYWSVTPGDPGRSDSGCSSASMPSPFWVNRFVGRPSRAMVDIVSERRKRLDRLGIAKPLQIPLGAPRDAVVEALLKQATAHIQSVSEGLYRDPAAIGGSQLNGEESEDDAVAFDKTGSLSQH